MPVPTRQRTTIAGINHVGVPVNDLMMKCSNVMLYIPNLLASDAINELVLKIVPINRGKILEIELRRTNKRNLNAYLLYR